MQLSSVGLPILHTYAEALARLENTMPFRSGSKKGLIPLGDNRRYTYCTIHKHDDGTIALQLHSTDLVQFYANGEIHVTLGDWDTPSTRQFIYGSTPYSIKHDRGTTYLAVGDKWYAFPSSRSILVIKDNVVINPTQEKTYKLNRKAMREKRSLYQPFIEYVESMGKVLTAIPDTEVLAVANRFTDFRTMTPVQPRRYYRGPNPREHVEKFLQSVKVAQENNDLQLMYDLFVLLGVSALRHDYFLKAYVSSLSSRDDESIGGTMVLFFDEILKNIYNKEVFTQEEVPIGKHVSNKNRQYFV